MLGSLIFALSVAVTFDDLPAAGPDRSGTEAIVSINRSIVGTLTKRHIPAVGFVNEIGLETNGGVDPARVAALKTWLDHGLTLGNHTYSHPSLHKVTREVYLDVESTVAPATGAPA